MLQAIIDNGFVLRINTCGKHPDAKRGKLVFQLCEAGQLPAAVRSPMPPEKQHHAVLGVKAPGLARSAWQVHRAAADHWNGHRRKETADMKFFSHA